MESIKQGPIPKTESSAVNPYNGMFGQQGWIARSVGECIHLLLKCVCIVSPIIQQLFLILVAFLIRPPLKKS